MKFVIVDIETTGLSPHRHGITEIAAVRFDGEKITDTFQELINPERHIPSFITKLTGISNEMIEGCPVISEILPKLIEFLDEDIFVAHNSSFDLGFLNHYNYEHFGQYIQNKTLCTKKLTKHLMPGIPKRNLAFLCEHFGIKNSNADRALSDVHATVELLKQLLKIKKQKGKTIEELLEI